MADIDSFSVLLDIHSELDAIFAEHQFALLHFDFDLALEKLRDYERRLAVHMVDEEENLIPLYDQRVEIPKGGAAKLFLDEHEKMRAHIALFLGETERLINEEKPEESLLVLLDRESFYKRLCSHHDIREREILYPLLDSVTDPAERASLIDQSLRLAAADRAGGI